MNEDDQSPGLGLAEFLAALRAELYAAHVQADGSDIRLGVGDVEVSLDVAYKRESVAGGEARAKAKFWVLEVGEAGVSASRTWQHLRTQHLKLTLSPRVEMTVTDDQGVRTTISKPFDVVGDLEAVEENPLIPQPAPTSDDESRREADRE
jgi:hypothetical protein